ncbi:hypothetical protein LINPERHAP1_LOCUS23905 [Linum perenne]
MRGISRATRSGRFLFFLTSLSLHFLSGLSPRSLFMFVPVIDPCCPLALCDDAEKAGSDSHTGPKIIFLIVGIVAVGLVSFFLFKFWQKKKREEQYARLLKLFEEDDELEVELGLRD